MSDITITLPSHAVRYLRRMCERDRKELSKLSSKGYSIQLDAAYDSLDTIAEALPEPEPWEVVEP